MSCNLPEQFVSVSQSGLQAPFVIGDFAKDFESEVASAQTAQGACIDSLFSNGKI